jgi:hypothetical protein
MVLHYKPSAIVFLCSVRTQKFNAHGIILLVVIIYGGLIDVPLYYFTSSL